TVSTFVSLTAHCARCHDHKFDPIPQKDYYRLQAVFAGVERGDRPLNTPEVRQQRAALERQIRAAADRKAGAAEVTAPHVRLKAVAASSLVYAVVPRPPRPIH